MSDEMDAASISRREAYFAQSGAHLRDERTRASFAMYAFGLLGDGERKSAEAEAEAEGRLGGVEAVEQLPLSHEVALPEGKVRP